MSPKKHVPLTGSERSPLHGAKEIGPTDPNQEVEVTIRLRPRKDDTLMSHEEFLQVPHNRQHLTREQLEERHGADPASIRQVETFAQEHGLKVEESDPGRRTMVLTGTVNQMNNAFGVQLKDYEHPGGRYRGRTGAVNLPEDLQNVVEAVLGLDNRPQAKPHFRRRTQTGVRAHTPDVQYTPPQVAQAYKFPTNVDGTGECIAIVELGGGYKPEDLNTYWKQLKLAKHPSVTAVNVGKGRNHPTNNADGPDGEVMLDIEVVGGVAPGAKIVVYFAQNTDAGFLNAITKAVHDKTHKPSIISISWGGPESSWTPAAMTQMDKAFQSAAALGVTVTVAAGDDGSTDGVNDRLQHVDFPASSPNVLACGGTHLLASGSTITSETVWNELPNGGATGGGISDFFDPPTYQNGLGNALRSKNPGGRIGRGVPDVSGDADPSSGYTVLVDGQEGPIGGTSAVAPLWAGLVALLNEELGTPVGFLNPLLYQNAEKGGFRDVVSGNNGAYDAGTGWDACTGLGTPIGTALAAVLSPAQAVKTGT